MRPARPRTYMEDCTHQGAAPSNSERLLRLDEEHRLQRTRNLGPAKAGWSLACSVVAHVAVLGAVGWIAYRSLSAREAREARLAQTTPPEEVVSIELPRFSDGALVADREDVPEGAPPDSMGGATVARVDEGAAGRGGSASGARATNLAAMDDSVNLYPDEWTGVERDQLQRLETSRKRTTHEDRRATTHPMELTFLATGKGERMERRPSAPSDPSRGSLSSARPAVLGGHPGTRDADDDDVTGGSAGAARAGEIASSPGVGVRDGAAGAKHSEAARVALGRPMVAEGPPTIPAIVRGRPNDTVDSDQAVASTVRSIVHASVAGALLEGPGRGGTSGPESDPGAGGAGRGSIARPLGRGDGDAFDWYDVDPAWVAYKRHLHSKIDPLWANAFPKSAMLELKQGTVILSVTIAANGAATVHWPPVRPSGIDEFDRNCADAVRRAGPFNALPASLGRSSMTVKMPFEAKNPIIK